MDNPTIFSMIAVADVLYCFLDANLNFHLYL